MAKTSTRSKSTNYFSRVEYSYTTLQTAKGFELSTGGSFQAWVWAILIGLTLSYLALELSTRLKRGSKSGAILIAIIYLFVAGFSFVANFNYFYSSTTRNQIENEHLEDIQDKLFNLKSNSFNATNKLPDKIRKLKVTIIYQLLDPISPDWGSKTQLIADTLGKYLGVTITKPSGTPKQKAESVSKQIDDLLKNRLDLVSDFKNSVNTNLNKFESDLKKVRTTEDKKDDAEQILKGLKLYNSICNESVNIISDKSIFECEYLKSYKDEEIGQIQYSLKTALDRPKDAIIPFLQSAFLDLLLPFLIILSSLTKKRKSDPSFPDRRMR